MAPDPERVADTRAWPIKAQHDLRAADALLAGGEPLPDVAASSGCAREGVSNRISC